MSALNSIHWTPEIYFGVLSVFQVVVLFIAARLAGIPVTLQTSALAIVGSLLISAVSYALTDVSPLVTFLIFLGVAFIVSMVVTKLNALVSLASTFALVVVVALAGTFLCYPYTDLYRSQVGGVTKFIYKLKYTGRIGLKEADFLDTDKVLPTKDRVPPKP